MLLLVLPEFIPISDTEFLGVTLDAWGFHFQLFCYQLMIPILGISLFKFIPKKLVKFRTLLLCVLFFVILEAIIGIIQPVIEYEIYNLSYLIMFFVLSALYLMSCFKRYNFKSDPIKDNNVYICFHKPVTTLMQIGSLVGFPVGGMSIYLDGELYTYKVNTKVFGHYEQSAGAIQEKFTVYDTGILTNAIIERELRLLIGKKAGKRLNCVWTLRNVLKQMGPKFTPDIWTMLPSTYMLKVFP